MFPGKLTAAGLVFSLAMGHAPVAMADGSFAGGLFGAIIGTAIVNEASKTHRRRVVVPNAVRAERREIQTALNYFGFPAGPADGVLGRRSRQAISGYQAHLGYPITGHLTDFEKGFLLSSYRRAMAGGATTVQMIASEPMGAKGLLIRYRDEMAGKPAADAAQDNSQVASAANTPAPALPNFLGGSESVSLASQCNRVSLLTNSNGGFTTQATMRDPEFALNEQFCLARTYAIEKGEELARKVQGATPDQIAAQCDAFGPAMKEYVAELSLKPLEQVQKDVGAFVLKTGMSPAQLSGTAKICLSAGYRTDKMDVALASALLLTVLGEKTYAELIGHHLELGFGTNSRPDLAMAWYQTALDALDNGAEAVFAPGQPERNALIRTAANATMGGEKNQQATTPAKAQLPAFSVNQ